MGLRISFGEHLGQVLETLNDLTVRNLVETLRDTVRKLSASSSIKDFVFLTATVGERTTMPLSLSRPASRVKFLATTSVQ